MYDLSGLRSGVIWLKNSSLFSWDAKRPSSASFFPSPSLCSLLVIRGSALDFFLSLKLTPQQTLVLSKRVIEIAVQPPLSRFGGSDHRMAAGVGMVGGMAIRR